jgi:hypothetical protein
MDADNDSLVMERASNMIKEVSVSKSGHEI